MFFNLLEVSEETTNIVKYVSIGVAVLLVLIIAVLCIGKNKKYDVKRLAFAGISLALSFVLAHIKVKPVQYGGSITLASFAPVLIYAYVYGPFDALLVGVIHGLLNFIESPYILTPTTFALDYLLAFASIGFMGLLSQMPRKKKECKPLVIGTVSVYIGRFFFHFLSGIIYFVHDAIWVDLPDWAMTNATIYSFIYQCVYIPADAVITLVVLITLAKTGVLDMLTKMMKKGKTVTATQNTETTQETANQDTDVSS